MRRNYICSSSKCKLPVTKQLNSIIVHGAEERNLKKACFMMPKNRLVALTGLSGSGKSSIAFGVLGQECVRQYLDSLGMITDHVPKAKVGTIMGLSPSICILQRVTDFNPRSTVGTKTGVLTILRNLFASIGHQPCVSCGTFVKHPLQDKHKLKTIVEEEKKKTSTSSSKKRTKSYFDCPNCSEQLEKLKMDHFLFSATSGACEDCKGTGEIVAVDIPNLLDEKETISNGGVKVWDTKLAKYKQSVILAASKHYNFPFNVNLPIRSYTKKQKDFLLYGITFPDFVKEHKDIEVPKKVSDGNYDGIVPYLMEQYKSNPEKPPQFVVHNPCSTCKSTRLGRLGRTVTVAGKTIIDVVRLNLNELLTWIQALDQRVAKEELQVLAAFSTALEERISNIIEVGLDYLTLDRTLPSLSAGESQRLRLANVIGSGLTGVLYVLDEPTTGLHPHDTAKLLKALQLIKEAGNTVLVIEHDLDVIRNADHIIDVGPGRGSEGGEIVVSGTLSEVMACPESITGQYLKKKVKIDLNPPQGRNGKAIIVRGASEHNLKNIDVSIPINQFVVMTGVSGSGKSTFLFDILDKVAREHLNGASEIPGKHASVEGLEHFNRVVTVDQVTIGKTKSSRSNVATYTKLFDLIRDLFASLPEAKKNNFIANSFSFNTSEQRCDNCNGAGVVEVDLAFMPEVEMECPACDGMRFNENLLAVKFQGLNIAEILDMTVSDAIPIFKGKNKILNILNLMMRVGLEHLALGQSTSTLSGGEAQRIKLASELSKSGRECTLYLLDEPTTGLHSQEVEKLLVILRELVSKGNTVIVIEHNLDIIGRADTIIDFGPGGGTTGGKIVATGTPQEVAANKDSLTGQCLQAYIEGKSVLTTVFVPTTQSKNPQDQEIKHNKENDQEYKHALHESLLSCPSSSFFTGSSSGDASKQQNNMKKQRLEGMESVHGTVSNEVSSPESSHKMDSDL